MGIKYTIKQMKKLFISVIAILGIVFAGYAQTKYEQSGNTFKMAKTERAIKKGAEPLKTPFVFEDTKGVKYPIYISNGGKGSAYIIKVSKKTGKEYKAYLGKEITAEIKKQLNIN